MIFPELAALAGLALLLLRMLIAAIVGVFAQLGAAVRIGAMLI